MERKPASWLTWAAIVVAGLALYVGAYYTTVDWAWGGIGRIFPHYRVPGMEYLPQVDSWLGMIFSPIHELDRHIRPNVWQP